MQYWMVVGCIQGDKLSFPFFMVWEEEEGWCVGDDKRNNRKKKNKREYKNYPKALVSPSFPWTPFVMLFINKKRTQ